jgi:hypothetical protein
MRLAAQQVPATDLVVVDSAYRRDDNAWRVVLSAPGARFAHVARAIMHEALAVAIACEGGAGIDLHIVDPDDATVERRVTLTRAELQELQLSASTSDARLA